MMTQVHIRLVMRPNTASCARLRLRNGAGLLVAFLGCLPAWADEAADQLERARVLREVQEAPSRMPVSEVSNQPVLPAAALDRERLHAAESFRMRQIEDAQWRNLIGAQQMQLHQPSNGAGPESQWRAQTFERERQAQDLSADILRRDLEYKWGGHR